MQDRIPNLSQEAYEKMVAKAARALCKQESASCNVDPEDNWKIYGDEFINDARAMLEAIGAKGVIDALLALANTADNADSDFKGYRDALRFSVRQARDAHSKATGSAS